MEYAWNRRWIPSDVGGSDGSGDTVRSRSFKALWQMRFSDEGLLLQSIAATPCLILLGEPGMGKTYAVRREYRRLDSLRREHGIVHIVDLLGSDSPQHVRERLFSNQTYRDWKAGRHQLTYFIDSVDRTATPVDHVLAELHNELRTADLFRLRLRLVCRDYDWSIRFADGLRSLWGETSEGVSKVHVFQLAPLRYEDICLAAQCNELDPKVFLKDLEAADALPLATIPITLEMLLRTGELTSNRLELYEKGIRRFCRQAEERGVSEKRLSERVMTASSMAAVMLLGDKYRVDIESESIGESILSVRDLLRDADSENEEKLACETLKTGLFKGGRERSWIHQSFAEYLAAVYLSAPEITVKEIVKITTNGNGVFATQLYEVLRWLIEMRPDVLNEIVERQPALLLTTDLSHLDKEDFRRVYKAMLSLDDPYIYSSKTWDLKKFHATHPSAGRVLLPYLQDNEGNVHRRRFVMDLLECHGYPNMEDTLVDLALNEYEDRVLRRLAARGLQKVGSIEAKLELKPYVFGREDDPDDEIKGYALRALWPCHLTVDELFNALTPPKQESYVGSYRVFLIENSIVNDLSLTDLPAALMWVAAQPSRHEMPFSLQELPGKIMRKAWENRHIPGVLEAFATTAITTDLVRFDGVFARRPNTYPPDKELDEFENAFVQDTQYRRELVLMCLPYLGASDEKAWHLAHTWPPIVVPEDLDWLLGLLESEIEETRRGQLAELVACLFRSDIEKVYYASERHPEVKERTKHYFESRLDDPNVISDRERFYRMKEIDEQIAQQRAEARPFERLQEALEQLEAGEYVQWLNVIYALSVGPPSGASWHIEPDLTEFPNWKPCNDTLRVRIIQNALTYVLRFEYRSSDPYDENWYFTNQISHAEFAGYRALFLLLKMSSITLDEIPSARWRKWSKIIVWFPLTHIILNDGRTAHHERTRDQQLDLLRRLYRIAQPALLENLRDLLTAEDGRDSSIGQTLDKVEHLWDPALETTLVDLLRDSSLSARGQRSLLDMLVKHDSDGAVRFAEEMIRKSYSNEMEQERLVQLCVGLMLSELEFDWQAVWNEIQHDENVGKAIVEKIAREDRSQLTLSAYVSARELADLFLWVEERYPSSEDPQIDGFHVVDTREEVGRWRNNIIAELRKKNSQEALLEIRRILDHFPHLEWIQHSRVGLEETVEELDWEPALPSEVLDLSVVKEKRPRIWKREAVGFLKRNWKWVVGFAAKFLSNLI